MKRLYMAFAVATLATMSFAQPLSTYRSMKDKPMGKPVDIVMSPVGNKTAMLARMKKAAGNADIITEQPKGTLHDNLYGTGEGFMTFFNSVYSSASDGTVERYVETDNGEVYIQNIVSTISPNTWVKGEKAEGDTIKFVFPQKYVAQEGMDDDGNPTGIVEFFYLYRCRINAERTSLDLDETSQTISYVLRNDSLIRVDNLDNGVILALCNGAGEWTGFGDYYQTWTKIKDEPCVPSASANKMKYQLDFVNTVEQYDSRIINVAIDGNDFYLGGLTDSAPDNWVKGKIDGDKVVFEGKKYMGVDKENKCHAYFSALGSEKVWSDYYHQEADSFFFVKSISFDYDAENKTLKSDKMFGVNMGTSTVKFINVFMEPQMKPWNDLPANPKDPDLLEFRPYDPNYGYGAMLYWLDNMSVDDNLLNADYLYYNLYFDGELFTAYPDEYVLLKEAMTDIPYSFSDGYDFNFTGSMHNMFFYMDGVSKVGIQAMYKYNDKVYKSNLVEFEITEDGFRPTAVNGVTDDADRVLSVSFYDLSGRRVSNPSSGIYLKTMKMADGTQKTVKIVKR